MQFVQGNIFDSGADAIVNTVNTQGVMGKGIALQFKKRFPHNFVVYSQACKNQAIGIGKLLFVQDTNLLGGQTWVINFPTKTTWRKPSEYSYIEQGLADLVKQLPNYPIRSVAIPPLGCGNGGLEWPIVKQMIKKQLAGIGVDVIVYEPGTLGNDVLHVTRDAQLTDARALLLYILYDLVSQGELVSEFSSEKVCYFLQRFGAQKYFNLQYKPYFYGPYSGKVRHVLNYLNGSYVMGYHTESKKPFEPLGLVASGRDKVAGYFDKSIELKAIASQTSHFLSGFYSDFSLELLSTIDYLMLTQNISSLKEVKAALGRWSERKRSLFHDDRYIEIALEHLKATQFEPQPHPK